MLALANLAATLGGVVLGYLFIRWFHARLVQPLLGPLVAETFGISEYNAGLAVLMAVVLPLAVLVFSLPTP